MSAGVSPIRKALSVDRTPFRQLVSHRDLRRHKFSKFNFFQNPSVAPRMGLGDRLVIPGHGARAMGPLKPPMLLLVGGWGGGQNFFAFCDRRV